MSKVDKNSEVFSQLIGEEEIAFVDPFKELCRALENGDQPQKCRHFMGKLA